MSVCGFLSSVAVESLRMCQFYMTQASVVTDTQTTRVEVHPILRSARRDRLHESAFEDDPWPFERTANGQR